LFKGHPDIIDEPAKGLERLKSNISLNEIAKPQHQHKPMILDFNLNVLDTALQFSRYDLSIEK
jgi:hypothetical protein